MKTFVFLLSYFITFSYPAFGKQPEKRHLYVEWRHWDSTIVLGEMEGRKFKQKILLSCAIQELERGGVYSWLGESGNSEVLLYFHAMWGQQANFQRKCLRSVEEILDNQPDTGIQTVISFIWHAGGVAYPLNWRQADEKGEPLGEIIGWIGEHYNGKINVLCHSMGNRFFEGVLRETSYQPGENTLFNTVILFSPDLDADVSDPDFLRLCQSAKEVAVFIHRHDRFLMLSDWTFGRERLGRSGPKGDLATFAALSHLSVIDMTDHVKGLQNHTHLDKAWVQERMQEVLEE